jgi:hypothetical protein
MYTREDMMKQVIVMSQLADEIGEQHGYENVDLHDFPEWELAQARFVEMLKDNPSFWENSESVQILLTILGINVEDLR